MALQSEVAPLGEADNNTFDVDNKSEEDSEEDLEEGEILDSGEEQDEPMCGLVKNISKPPSKNNEVKSPKKHGEFVSESDDVICLTEQDGKNENKFNRPPSMRRSYGKYSKSPNYVDHDHADDEEDENEKKKKMWYERAKKSKDAQLDYRDELAAYRGSDLSSPERDSKGDKHLKRKRKNTKSRSKKIASMKRRKLLEKQGKIKKEIKHRPCKFWQEGQCHKGSECQFQHIRPSSRKKELCRYYLSGFCNKVKNCPYMHDDFPCKFFHTNTTCYAGDTCRFSHKPLTAEMERILHDYLKLQHGDDYHHDKPLPPPRKRERTPSPEPMPPPPVPLKRCLLGSPPRHVKEAEETKHWQEMMRHLQKEQNTDAFQISVGPAVDHFKPNFYMDTMKSPVKTPQKGPESGPNNRMPPQTLPNFGLECEDISRFTSPIMGPICRKSTDWKNIQQLIDKIEAPMMHGENGSEISSVDASSSFESDPINSHEPRSFSHSNSIEESDLFIEDNEGGYFPGEKGCRTLKLNDGANSDRDDSNSAHASGNTIKPPSGNSSPTSASQIAELPDPDPIVIPNHLPPKQRELLMRIQKHQKLKSAESDDLKKMEENKSESESQVTETHDDHKEKMKGDSEKIKTEESLDSSDDDEDDSYDPLTVVLQKLNQSPPPKPKPKEIPISKEQPINPNLSQMLSSIMQKANENRSGSLYQEQNNKFWTNILTGTVPPVKSDSSAATTYINPMNSATDEGNNATRRVLLPSPKIMPLEKPAADIRDPRLKSRDPRTAAVNVAANIPKSDISNIVPPILPLDVSTGSHLVNHHRDLNSLVPNQTPAVIVEGLKGNVPYKLHGVSAKPLNYTPYLQASHSDPKLLNDPRLRKLLTPGSVTVAPPSQSPTEKFICSVPKPSSILPELPLFNQLKLEKSDMVLSALQEPPSSLEMPSLPEIELPQLQPQVQKVTDPRTRRVEQRRSSGNNTPPHLTPAEPPILQPPVNLPVVPKPASHLPRAIADPRMATLIHPLDPRRPRIIPGSVNSKNLAKPTPEPKKTPAVEAKPNTEPQQQQQPEAEKEEKVVDVNNESVSKKNSEEEVPKKNSAVRRNRKTSMDYASPLNAYDDSRTSDLNYNSYNKRPKKPTPSIQIKDQVSNEAPTVISTSESQLILDFSASDNSNLDAESMDANLASLKDVFKTRDPTASPFC